MAEKDELEKHTDDKLKIDDRSNHQDLQNMGPEANCDTKTVSSTASTGTSSAGADRVSKSNDDSVLPIINNETAGKVTSTEKGLDCDNTGSSNSINPPECQQSATTNETGECNNSSKDSTSDFNNTSPIFQDGDSSAIIDEKGEDCNHSSDESDSECEYESAEEGEEIQTDAQNLREMEESLTDEQKEERRGEAQDLKESGNEMFRNGSYKSSIKAYSRALRVCPLKFAKDRAIMYSNRAACKMRLEENEDCIRDCTKALELHPQYLKALMRRAELYEKTDKLDEALTDFQKILEMDPSQYSARAACMRLPDQIKERNEKLKEEMMGKLKDLGNMVLRPFGLSTNNFKLNQDPNTGGYSVNFVQNQEQNQ